MKHGKKFHAPAHKDVEEKVLKKLGFEENSESTEPRSILLIEPKGDTYVFDNKRHVVPDNIIVQVFVRTRRNVSIGYVTELQFLQLMHGFCTPLPKPTHHDRHEYSHDPVPNLLKKFKQLLSNKYPRVSVDTELNIFSEIIKERMSGTDVKKLDSNTLNHSNRNVVRTFEFFNYLNDSFVHHSNEKLPYKYKYKNPVPEDESRQVNTQCVDYITDKNKIAIVCKWHINFVKTLPTDAFIRKLMTWSSYCCESLAVYLRYTSKEELTWTINNKSQRENYEALSENITTLYKHDVYSIDTNWFNFDVECSLDKDNYTSITEVLSKKWHWNDSVIIHIKNNASTLFIREINTIGDMDCNSITLVIDEWTSGYKELFTALQNDKLFKKQISVVFSCNKENMLTAINVLNDICRMYKWKPSKDVLRCICTNTSAEPAFVFNCEAFGNDLETCSSVSTLMVNICYQWNRYFYITGLEDVVSRVLTKDIRKTAKKLLNK